MLPDLRAVLAATIATVGLLMLAFGAVAAFRVAQGSHGALQADLTRRARMAELAPPTRHRVRVIDTPGPHIAPFPPLPVREVKEAPIASRLIDVPAPVTTPPSVAPGDQPAAASPTPDPQPAPAAAAPAPLAAPPPVVAASPSPESAMGGPFAEPRPPTDAERAAAKAERARKLAAARKARAARLARQRKAAARRAALARARQLQSQQATSFGNTFGNSTFGGGFGQQPAQATGRKARPATARSDAPFSPGGQQ